VSAGLLLNAALITTLGFILSCTLCYLLAWMFTQFLAINLPGLTNTGWI